MGSKSLENAVFGLDILHLTRLSIPKDGRKIQKVCGPPLPKSEAWVERDPGGTHFFLHKWMYIRHIRLFNIIARALFSRGKNFIGKKRVFWARFGLKRAKMALFFWVRGPGYAGP